MTANSFRKEVEDKGFVFRKEKHGEHCTGHAMLKEEKVLENCK